MPVDVVPTMLVRANVGATGRLERLMVSPLEALAVVPVKLVRARVGLPWEWLT